MFIFNTTFTVEEAAYTWWREWMRDTYAAEICGAVPDATLEIFSIDGTATAGSRSFSAMWRCHSLADLGQVRSLSMRHCQKLLALQGERCLAFSTLMRKQPIV